jgi:phage gp36-like protein
MAAVLIDGNDLIARKDVRVIADLLSDSGSPVSESAVPTHAKVVVALEDAEGEVVGNLQAFGRYTTAELALLTGSAQAFLKRVISEIAMINLIVRRPDLSAEDLERHEKIRTQWLDRLQNGTMIFATDDTDDSASRASVDGATLGEFHKLNLMRDRSRYFPNRMLPHGRNY